MDLLDKAVPGSETVPGGRVGTEYGDDIKEGSQGECLTALATAERTGVTKGCFCIATEGRPLAGGGCRVLARSG